MKSSRILLLIIIIIIGIMIFIRLGQVIYVLNQNDKNENKKEEINNVEIIPNSTTTTTTTTRTTTSTSTTKIITTTKPITTKPITSTTTTTTTTTIPVTTTSSITNIKETFINYLEYAGFKNYNNDKTIYYFNHQYSVNENNAEHSCLFITTFSFETLVYDRSMTCTRINDNNIVYELYIGYDSFDNTSKLTLYDASYEPHFINAYTDKNNYFTCNISDCYDYHTKLLQWKSEFFDRLESANVTLQELRKIKIN